MSHAPPSARHTRPRAYLRQALILAGGLLTFVVGLFLAAFALLTGPAGGRRMEATGAGGWEGW